MLRSQVSEDKARTRHRYPDWRATQTCREVTVKGLRISARLAARYRMGISQGGAVIPRLVEMSRAVEKLRHLWNDALELDEIAEGWLGLQDVKWRGVALDHILQARPPIHSVGSQTAGASVLRWFLHRVLPYPAFLTDIHWTATRLGVTAAWLKEELQTDSEMSRRLFGCRYSGAFEDFTRSTLVAGRPRGCDR